MGRAERRRAERANRIEERKGKILMSKQDLGKMQDSIRQDISNFNVEAILTCLALALHRKFKFGPKRIMRVLNYIDELMGGVVDDMYTVDDYKQQLKEETGVVIKC